MHLLLIRHGQSTNNVLEAAHGSGEAFDQGRSIDPPLSRLGEQQAELLGKHLGAQLLASRGRVRVLCSSMRRALQTLMPLAQRLHLQIEVRPELHEVKGFYDTSGRVARGPGRAELLKFCPSCKADSIPDEGQGSETAAEALERARRVVELLRTWAAVEAEEATWAASAVESPADEKIVVIVSHNDFIGLLSRLLLAPSASFTASETPESLFRESYWPMNNTGVTHMILGVKPPPAAYPTDIYMLYWNRSDHLPERLRSGVQYKNIGFMRGAEWARVGEGGSQLKPKFAEGETFHNYQGGGRQWHILAAAGSAVALGIAALLVLPVRLPKPPR